MKRVRTKPLHIERTPKKEIDTPLADAFNKAANYTRPLLKYELLRKRRVVKGPFEK